MQRIIDFSLLGGKFILYGYELTRNELTLLLGIHGFYVDENLSNLEFYGRTTATLAEISETQLLTSLVNFSGYSPEEKLICSKEVERLRLVVENLGNN